MIYIIVYHFISISLWCPGQIASVPYVALIGLVFDTMRDGRRIKKDI